MDLLKLLPGPKLDPRHQRGFGGWIEIYLLYIYSYEPYIKFVSGLCGVCNCQAKYVAWNLKRGKLGGSS